MYLLLLLQTGEWGLLNSFRVSLFFSSGKSWSLSQLHRGQLIAGPDVSVWRFGTLVKGNLVEHQECPGTFPFYQSWNQEFSASQPIPLQTELPPAMSFRVVILSKPVLLQQTKDVFFFWKVKF